MPFGTAMIYLDLIDADTGEEEFNSLHDDVYHALQTRLLRMEFSDHERKKDQMKITLRNDDFALLENSLFVKGQKFAASWGWPGEMKTPRRLVVTKIKGGNPIDVFMLDTSQLFDKEKVSRNYDNATDSEIIREIGHAHGYRGQFLHIDETKTRSDVSQRYTTDARFCAKLARKNGFEFWVDSSGLHWHKRRTNGDVVKNYFYRSDPNLGDMIGEPKFDVNLSKAVSKVKVVCRDPRTKEWIEVTGGPDDTEIDSMGREDEMGNPDDENEGLRASRLARTDVRYSGMMTREQAQEEADARYRMTVQGRYKMSFEAMGDGRVGAKMLIGVYGVSDSWDGMFYVRECIDVIQNGKFTQSLKTEKDALGKIWAAQIRKPGKKAKPNPKQDDPKPEEMDFTQLRQVRTVTTNSRGEPAVVNMWVTNQGEVLDTRDEQTISVDDDEITQLATLGAQSHQPDSGM